MEEPHTPCCWRRMAAPFVQCYMEELHKVLNFFKVQPPSDTLYPQIMRLHVAFSEGLQHHKHSPSLRNIHHTNKLAFFLQCH